MDWADKAGLVMFVGVSVGLPLCGYWLMYCDVCAYMRRLRRALVVATHLVVGQPSWMVRQAPPVLRVLGLDEDCTEADIREAYRRLAEACHPDRGGSQRDFHRLRRNYEAALAYYREHHSSRDSSK